MVFHSAVAARLGMTVTDLSCLNLVSLEGPQTPGQLAERIGITRGGAVTAMIDRLERAGYLRREPDPADRRRVLIGLNDTARTAVSPLFATLGAAIGADLEDYDDGELDLLLTFVAATNDRVADATDTLRGGS
ncbi:MarR family winged helix-turn-helix transcriptional regulator [Nocardia sp. IFM 10818]